MENLPTETILDLIHNYDLSATDVSQLALSSKRIYNIIHGNKDRIALSLFRHFYSTFLKSVHHFSLDFFQMITSCYSFPKSKSYSNVTSKIDLFKQYKIPPILCRDSSCTHEFGFNFEFYLPTKACVINKSRFYFDKWMGKCLELEKKEYIKWYLNNYQYAHIHRYDIIACIKIAITSNKLNIIIWLFEEFKEHIVTKRSFTFIDHAAKCGHLHIVKWFHENNIGKCTEDAMDFAASNGDMDTLQFLHYNRREGCTIDAMDGAARNGHLDVAVWLHENRREGCSYNAMDGAARNGHMHIVKWLHENQINRGSLFALYNSLKMGHKDIFMYLHENGYRDRVYYCAEEAAARGYLDVIKILHEHKYKFTKRVMTRAAIGGHIDVLNWLRENRKEGCLKSSLEDAARNNQLEAVKWIHSNYPQCKCPRKIFFGVTDDDEDEDYIHNDVAKYLLENIEETDFIVSQQITNAVYDDKPERVQMFLSYYKKTKPIHLYLKRIRSIKAIIKEKNKRNCESLIIFLNEEIETYAPKRTKKDKKK